MNLLAVGSVLITTLLAADCPAGNVAPTPAGWLDSAPLTKQSVILPLSYGARVRIDVLGDRLFRIRHAKNGQWRESALNRYGILACTLPEVAFEQSVAEGVHTLSTGQARLAISLKNGTVTLSGAGGKPLVEHAQG